MTELTETEYRTLRMKTLTILGEISAADNATATAIAANLVPTVEAIVRKRVAEALDRAAVKIDAEASIRCRDSYERGWQVGMNGAARMVREVAA